MIPFLGIEIIAFLSAAYTFIVPGGVAWLLTVRRTNSHDFYDMLKPPLVSLAFVMLLLVCIRLLDLPIPIITLQFSESQGIIIAALPSFLAAALAPFIGVIISEAISRFKKRYL